MRVALIALLVLLSPAAATASEERARADRTVIVGAERGVPVYRSVLAIEEGWALHRAGVSDPRAWQGVITCLIAPRTRVSYTWSGNRAIVIEGPRVGCRGVMHPHDLE